MLTISSLKPGTEYWSEGPYEVVGRWTVQEWVPSNYPKQMDVVTFQPDGVTTPMDAAFVMPWPSTTLGNSKSVLLKGYCNYSLGSLLMQLSPPYYPHDTKGMTAALWRFSASIGKRKYRPSIFAEPLPLP
jgi:hypothetical protein